MNSNKLSSLLIAALLITSAIIPTHGYTDTSGGCVNLEFPLHKNGDIDWPRPLLIIKEGTPVFPESTGSDPLKNLSFGTSLNAVRATDNRILVRAEGSSTGSLGWINRSDLLCGFMPLKGETGLEQKFYIQTITDLRHEKPSTVKAYPSPDLKSCHGKCRELSRFSGYFVFDYDKAHNSYLLNDYFRLESGSTLVGWVSAESGFIWDTAYGLRPEENLVFPDGHEMAGQEKTIFAYPTKKDAIAETNRVPILGGKRWFKIAHRIPITGRVEINGKPFYHVVLPIAGTIGIEQEELKIKIVNPKDLTTNQGIDTILEMKRIDILFLIDGTKTLAQYIEKLRGSVDPIQPGIVQQLINDFRNDPDLRETQLRFGFRIYRDQYAGQKEMGEGLPLTSDCEITQESMKNNLSIFNKEIQSINTSENDWETGDDYEENLFGGMLQAVKDLRPCAENLKILFVIGDHGYSARAQKQKGRDPIGVPELSRRLKGSIDSKERNIVLFFIQTPNNRSNARHPEGYDSAYRLFREQAKQILRLALPPQRRNDSGYLLEASDEELNKKIIAGVKAFAHPKALNELVLDLRGGASLVDAIERLQGSQEYNNIPGLFWDIVKQGSAKKLGRQYQSRIYDAIIRAFVPATKDVVEDVWLKSDDLAYWVLLLKAFGDQTSLSGNQLRKAFGFAIKDALEKIIKEPLYEHTGEKLSVYLQRKGHLPVRDTSPLFRYSIDDLKDPFRVPDCELIRLAVWLKNVGQMLSIVAIGGGVRPKLNIEQFPGRCSSGNHIPFISGDVDREAIGPSPEMRFDHSFQKARIFWIPSQYLP